MSGIGKQFLTSAFRVALWAGIGAGVMAVTDSPYKEQLSLPSLSQQDAGKNYHNKIDLAAGMMAGMELGSILGEAKGRRKEPAAAKLTPT